MGNKQSFEKFDRFEDLPKPALQEILLKLERQQLYAICSISRKAFSICKEHNFQEMYNKIHRREMIYGNLHLKWKNHDDKGTHLHFEDDIRSIIRIVYSDDYVLKYLYYHNNAVEDGITIDGNRILFKNSNLDFKAYDELLPRLEEIGKEHWMNVDPINDIIPVDRRGLIYALFSVKIANEIWKIIQRETSKVYPDIKKVKLSDKYFDNKHYHHY